MTFKTVIFIVSIFVLINVTTSQISRMAKCPNIKPVEKFDQKQILGKWYETKRYPSSFLFGSCTSINIKEVNQSIQIVTNQTFPGQKTTPQSLTFGKRSMKGEAGTYTFRIGLGLGKNM